MSLKIKEVAQRIREEIGVEVRAAIATMDLWTNKYTAEHMLAFTLSWITTLRLLYIHLLGEETAANIAAAFQRSMLASTRDSSTSSTHSLLNADLGICYLAE